MIIRITRLKFSNECCNFRPKDMLCLLNKTDMKSQPNLLQTINKGASSLICVSRWCSIRYMHVCCWVPHEYITIRRKLIMTVTDDRVTWTKPKCIFMNGAQLIPTVFPRIIINKAHEYVEKTCGYCLSTAPIQIQIKVFGRGKLLFPLGCLVLLFEVLLYVSEKLYIIISKSTIETNMRDI